MKLLFKYLLLVVVGPLIILFCSLFQHTTLPTGEYHYSMFFGKNYTIPAVAIFLLTGIATGYYFNLNPWLTSLCLYLIFPIISIIEAIIYPGSHNLIPFEFVMYFVYALPAIFGVYIGRSIKKQVIKQNSANKISDWR